MLLTAEAFAADPAAGLQDLLIDLRRRGASCQSVARQAVRAWHIGEPHRTAVARIAAEADASGLGNFYHNPAHTRDVTVSWINLAMLHARLHAAGATPVPLGADLLATGLMAALGHDLLHDGNGMPPSGRAPFRLEAMAAQRCAAIMAGCGLGAAAVDAVRAAILSTYPPAGYAAVLPGTRRKAAPGDIHPGMAMLANPECLLVAAMLRDADLMTSAGLSAAEHDLQAALLSQEDGKDAGSPAATERFFRRTARGGFASPAGKLFMTRFRALHAINQLRLNAGRKLSMHDAARLLAGG